MVLVSTPIQNRGVATYKKGPKHKSMFWENSWQRFLIYHRINDHYHRVFDNFILL